MSNRSGSPYSAPRDSDHIPVGLGASTADGITPLPLEINPVTGRLIVDAAITSGGGGGTQYTDGQTPPANPIGGAIIFDNAGTWKDVGTDQPLPVLASGTVTVTQPSSSQLLARIQGIGANGAAPSQPVTVGGVGGDGLSHSLITNNAGILTVDGSSVTQPVSISTSQLDGSVTGTLSAVAQTVQLGLPSGSSASSIQLTGTFVGTVIFESSEDGVTFNARVYRGVGILNLLSTTTSTSPSEWRGNVGGMAYVRVRCTAYTSGTLTVVIRTGQGAAALFLNAPIPVGAESTGNTSLANSLLTATSFTGTFEDMSNVSSAVINAIATQNMTLNVQFSQDNSTVFSTTPYTMTANVPLYLSIPPRARYFRIKVDNNSGSTGTLNIETLYRAVATELFRSQLGSSSLLTDNVLAPPMRAILTGRQAVDTYVDQAIKANGAAAVNDDYSTQQNNHQTLVAGTDTTITFSPAVRAYKVLNWDIANRVLYSQTAIATNTDSTAARVGFAPVANVPNGSGTIPLTTTTVHVRSAGNSEVTVIGLG